MTPIEKLEHTLHSEIPLSQTMGIRVTSYDGASLRLTAPLAPNINHKSTAFGGSLYSLAVLCGWGLLHIKLAEMGFKKHIVIQEGNIQYLLPVNADIQAECQLDEAALKRFLRTLSRHGLARLSLNTRIHHNGQTAVTFTGSYVVHE
jgi:thioesterase domain-containing protein